MNSDLISREALKTNIDKFIGYLDEDMIYRIKVIIDNAPTVCSTQTRIASVVDLFGNRIEGYFDENRMLFFSGYGIVTAELIKQKNYKLIFEKDRPRNCENCEHNVQRGESRGCELWTCDFKKVGGSS